MSDDPRVQRLLEELLESRQTPEQVCRDVPELLPAVRAAWQRLRALDSELEALFPEPAEGGDVPRPPAAAAPPKIAGYSIDGVLGRGGVGIVYDARHLRLGRRVALKMLLAGEYAVPEELARFAREAEVVASLRHPNIVQVFDVGDHAGRPWFTMERLEGGSLAQSLAGRPRKAREAATLVATLAEAIEVSHAGGIVHRDLKPANILLDADGTPKISDFGLARRLEGGPELTRSGSRLGTPSYMAPEQALGQERLIGPAVDVYALGALLYELLTGRPPFRGESPAETERMVISEEPVSPSRLAPGVPRDLETICLQCLRKDPAARYASAAALAADLRRFLAGEPIAARPVALAERAWKWVRRRPVHTAAIAGGALLALTLGGWALLSGLERAATARAGREDLREVAAFERAGAWGEARTALERARARLGDADSRLLHDELARHDRDLALVARLEQIRLRRTAVVGGSFDLAGCRRRADAEYEAAFREAGYGGIGDAATTVAARVAASDSRSAVLAALDDWTACAAYASPARRDWVLDVARRADPEPAGWSQRMHEASASQNREKLAALAGEAETVGASLPGLVALAERLVEAGGDAVPLLQRLQQAHPDDFWVNLTLADALRDRQPGESIRYYQAAVSLRPDATPASNNFGMALVLDGRFTEALARFEELLRLDPSYATARANMGYCLDRAGRSADAVEACAEAVRLAPDVAALRANLAGLLARQSRFDEALEHAQRAVELDPESAATHTALGFVLNAMGRHDEAIEQDRLALSLDEGRAELHLHLGQALLSAGRRDEALAEGRRAVELGVHDANSLTNLCVLLRRSGQAAEAVPHGEAAVRLEPERPIHRLNLGIALAECGRSDEAIEQLRKAARIDPDYQLAHAGLGTELARKGRYEEALEPFRAAARLAPDSAASHSSLGQALLLTGRFREARESLARAIELYPESSSKRAASVQNKGYCDRQVALEDRIPALLAGSDQLAGAQEALDLVQLCGLQKRYAAGAHFAREAFAAQPSLAEELTLGRRYDAACFAALAAKGAGADGAALSDDERALWRGQSREWLRAEIEAWRVELQAGTPASRTAAQQLLAHWLQDPDMASLRDEAELAGLPEDERQACRALWTDAAALLARAGEDS